MRRSPPRQTEGAFTLVELMMVMAAVAILGMLLFSVGGMSLDAARSADCASRLRQIAMQWRQYGRANPVVTPAGRSGPGCLPAENRAGRTWADVLGADLEEGILQCPSQPSRPGPGYGLNPLCGAVWSYAAKGLAGGFLLTPEAASGARMAHMVDPSGTVVFSDAGLVRADLTGAPPAEWEEEAEAEWEPFVAFPFTGPAITGAPGHAGPDHGYDWGNTLPGAGIGEMGWDPARRPLPRHPTVNCGFADGHAEALPIGELLGPAWGEAECRYDNQPRP